VANEDLVGTSPLVCGNANRASKPESHILPKKVIWQDAMFGAGNEGYQRQT
jgi:hypothetical protein